MNNYTVRFENGDTINIKADRYYTLFNGEELNFVRNETKKCSCGHDIERGQVVATFPANTVAVWLVD